MNSFFSRNIRTIVNISLSKGKPIKHVCFLSDQLAVDSPSRIIISSLCKSLRKGLNWDTLCRKYDMMNLDEPIIEKVLLEFKEPNEAKKALSFFHCVAHNKKIGHGLKPYCITIHILARARLVRDVRGLLESMLMKFDGNRVDESLKFLVVDMLLSTYGITNSCPFVFHLLVQTYSKLHMFETAFDVCCYLDKHGFSLGVVTFNNLLHVTQKSADRSDLIWKVYGHMIRKRIYPNEVTVKILTNALCKAGDLQKFLDIINRIHGKRCPPVVVLSTSLVFRMFWEGTIEEGLVILKRMLQKNLILDTIAYSLIVYAKLKSGNLDSAKEVYGEMLCRGFCPNSFVYTLFIRAYCEEGMVEEAVGLMEEMVNMGLKPYDETYNCLIIGCAKTGKLVNSITLCEEMTEKGLLPSSSAFNEMVGKLCEGGNMKQANEMLTILVEKGILPDETTYWYLIDGYGKDRNISEILKLYYEMEFRSLSLGVPIFTSLIRILCENRKLEEAEKYLAIMKCRSLSPTLCIYEQLIFAHLEYGNKERARNLYNEMLQKGVEINQSITQHFCSEDLVS